MLDLTNDPIAVTLAGRTLKVRRLAFCRMMSLAQGAVVSTHLARIQTATAGLPQDRREAFLAAAIAQIPHGATLDDLAGDWAKSYEGGVAYLHEAIHQDQPNMTLDEVRSIIDAADSSEVYPVACWISGRSKDVPRGTTDADGKKKVETMITAPSGAT